MTTIGHNSTVTTDISHLNIEAWGDDELRAFVERIEAVERELAEKREDRKEIFAELEGRGFDAKAVRALVKLRKLDHSERQEQEAILELYKSAMGMA